MSDDSSNILSFKKASKNEVNFKSFGQLIAQGDVTAAARILRDLLGLDFDKAQKSAEFFKNELHKDSNIILKTMSIRAKIELGQKNDALLLIQEVFGLDGIQSIGALSKITEKLESDTKKN